MFLGPLSDPPAERCAYCGMPFRPDRRGGCYCCGAPPSGKRWHVAPEREPVTRQTCLLSTAQAYTTYAAFGDFVLRTSSL